MTKNKKWSSSAKVEIVLRVLKGEETLNEICKKYSVAPSQVHAWKRHFLEHAVDVFSKKDKAAQVIAEQEATKRILYEKVGELTVERDFLKKCWSKLRENDDSNS
jgi:transposase-like protein